MAAAALGGLALVDLLIESTSSGGAELTLIGISLGTKPVKDAVALGLAAAVLITALLFLGVMALRAGKRRSRSRRAEERRENVASLENGMRLLEQKIELLLAEVAELEQRKAALAGTPPSGAASQPIGPEESRRVVVVPDTESSHPGPSS